MDFDLFDKIQRIGAEQHRRRETEKAQKRAEMDQPRSQDILEVYERVMSMFPKDLSTYVFCNAESHDSELCWIKSEGSRVTGRIIVGDAKGIPSVSTVYYRRPDITTYCENRYDPTSKQITYTSKNEIPSKFYEPQPSSYQMTASIQLWKAVVAMFMDNLGYSNQEN